MILMISTSLKMRVSKHWASMSITQMTAPIKQPSMCRNFPRIGHLWIEFDGVAMTCKVSCNGQLLGEHKGMFSRFSFDLTPQLKVGQNVISVYASMEKVPASTASLGQAVTVNLSAAKVVSMSKGMSSSPLSPNQDNRATICWASGNR